MNSMASIVPFIERHCVPTWQMRPCLRATSTMRRPSLTLWLTGFSTYTSLPACMAQMATRACQWLGVAVLMTVDRFVVEQLAQVLHVLWAAAGFLADFIATAVANGGVGVANGDKIDVFAVGEFSQMCVALAIDADRGDGEFFVEAFALLFIGGQRGPGSTGGDGGGRGGKHRIFQELAARKVRHGRGSFGVVGGQGSVASGRQVSRA